MAAENATYAVVKTGGKQYKVAVGDIVKVEKIESEPGSSVSLPVALVVNGADVTTSADDLAAEALHAEALRIRVTTVARAGSALLMCHVFAPYYLMPVTLSTVSCCRWPCRL